MPKKIYNSDEERRIARNAQARARYAAKKAAGMVVSSYPSSAYPSSALIGTGYSAMKTGKRGKAQKIKPSKYVTPEMIARLKQATKIKELTPTFTSTFNLTDTGGYYNKYGFPAKKPGRKAGSKNTKPRKTPAKRSTTKKSPAKKSTSSRKPNAYALFVKDNYASVKADNPGMSSKNVMREIASSWQMFKSNLRL